MAGASVSDIAFPLSQAEATNHMTLAQRQCTNKLPASAANATWWLRSPGSPATSARSITGNTGTFSNHSVINTLAVRPAL